MKARFIAATVLAAALLAAGQTPTYKYIRIGSAQDATTKATAGYALMGGGSDLDDAFRFLCEKGGGGDFLVLRAAGDDDYNDYIERLCKTNSIAMTSGRRCTHGAALATAPTTGCSSPFAMP